MNKFKFRLSKERSIDQPDVDFTAVLIEGKYCVEWIQKGLYHETFYSEKIVKEFLDDGDWIIIN